MEKILIFGLLLVICGLLILLFRGESRINELRDALDRAGTELREQRTRANLAERTVAATRYRLTECSRAVSIIAARNGTALEIVRELKKRFNEMEDLLFNNSNSNDTGNSSATNNEDK